MSETLRRSMRQAETDALSDPPPSRIGLCHVGDDTIVRTRDRSIVNPLLFETAVKHVNNQQASHTRNNMPPHRDMSQIPAAGRAQKHCRSFFAIMPSKPYRDARTGQHSVCRLMSRAQTDAPERNVPEQLQKYDNPNGRLRQVATCDPNNNST